MGQAINLIDVVLTNKIPTPLGHILQVQKIKCVNLFECLACLFFKLGQVL